MSQPQIILCPKCHESGQRTARFCTHCGHDMVLNNTGPRYYVTRIIKTGGQGAVYKAVGDDGAVYAVKEMLDGFTDPQERAAAVARFEAEAKLLEQLTHPRIPRVYTHFKDEGRHYLAMDFVRGEDLEEVIKREGPIPEATVRDWAAQICDVLGYLHDNGLIYRDMKPSNVMLDQDSGGIKLIDFGIARVLQAGQRGTQIGTPGYAPPEQYQGLATHQSDIYAFGATLHHLLTGRDPQSQPPFTFPPVRDLIPAVSADTSNAIVRALQMRPEDRYDTLDEFCAALGLATPAPSPPLVAVGPAASPTVAVGSAPGTVPAPIPAPAPTPAPRAPAPAPMPAPAAPTPGTAVPPAPARQSQGRRTGGVVIAVALVLILLLGLALVGMPLLRDRGLLGPSPTAQTLVLVPFRTGAEIIVPPGTSEAGLRTSFEYTFLVLAQQQYGPAAQLQPGSMGYANGQLPVRLGEDAQGVRYSATLEGNVLVPQQ